jgi:hypothetical protein
MRYWERDGRLSYVGALLVSVIVIVIFTSLILLELK